MNVGNLNYSRVSQGYYTLPFRGSDSTSVSEPADKNKVFEQQRELASEACAYATKSTAMAQILTSNNLKYSTTPQEYEKDLIKQGKIPNKNFITKVFDNQKDNNGTLTKIDELNSDGQCVKSTVFCRDNKYSNSWNEQTFYNTKHGTPYKSVTYQKDGGISVNNYNPIKNASVDSYSYRPDASLEYYRDVKNQKGEHYSKDGKTTKFSLEDKDGNPIKPKYDDDGNLLTLNGRYC